MNLPNLLTVLRIFFVPFLVGALLSTSATFRWDPFQFNTKTLALVFFLIASATDLLDGYLARRWGQITTVGTLLDPIADKLLISSALIAMVQTGVLPAWMAIIQIGREFAVTGFRNIAGEAGYAIGASDWGKWKMTGQVVMVAMLIGSTLRDELYRPALVVAIAVTGISLYGAIDYFFRFWKGIDETVKLRSRAELLREEGQRLREERDVRVEARRKRRLKKPV